uniref:Putative oxidoreductase n=1 Tax=uncultured marine bacterium PPT_M2 TaxID=1381397 RepID=A0A067XRQ5_9BACT|nr:putative oxidoreductase [uncultured marine bacterium PPT_M2]
MTTGDNGIRLMILDPGHFHAALVQKKMSPSIARRVHVYAPDGPELQDYLTRIQGFNSREQDPTQWESIVHATPDYLGALLRERPGNVIVTAGNNRRKTEYVKAAVDAGMHVLADKPMCIDDEGWNVLKASFDAARQNGVLLYDIMTERFEITSILQRELMQLPGVFGDLQEGTSQQPSVTKESVHYLSKTVAGKPLRRPPWYFDVRQQGEGIVDVTTHLVDLVMWICFPERTISYASDIEMLQARRWPTPVTRAEFEKVTGLSEFPRYLEECLQADGTMHCYCNGEMSYRLNGVHAKVSVVWNYEAREGGGDTHESRIHGSAADIVIHQGKAQDYQPELTIEPSNDHAESSVWAGNLRKCFANLQKRFPGVELVKKNEHFHVQIPSSYRTGHEAHFSQVAELYLDFLRQGRLPEWEVPNMLAKYYTTTQALELAKRAK